MTRRAILIVMAVMTTAAIGIAPVGAAETRTPLVGVNGFSALVRLEPGDSGDDVAALQEALAKAGFYHSAVDGEFGRTTASAVVAFHKYLGLDRSGAFSALDWIRLALLPDPGLPSRWSESDYIEVDLARQLLFLVEDGELARVMPVSTGGGYAYTSPRTGNTAIANTPQGDFRLKWHQLGWGVRSGYRLVRVQVLGVQRLLRNPRVPPGPHLPGFPWMHPRRDVGCRLARVAPRRWACRCTSGDSRQRSHHPPAPPEATSPLE